MFYLDLGRFAIDNGSLKSADKDSPSWELPLSAIELHHDTLIDDQAVFDDATSVAAECQPLAFESLHGSTSASLNPEAVLRLSFASSSAVEAQMPGIDSVDRKLTMEEQHSAAAIRACWLASTVVRQAAVKAFAIHGRSTTAPDIIAELGMAFRDIENTAGWT
jgi:hypothetical protein